MLLFKNIRQVITLRGGAAPRRGAEMSELGIIENGAILIRADRIAWVGSTPEIPHRGRDRQCQTLDGMGLDLIALPGFVDCHTHPIFGDTRADEYDMRCRGMTYQEIAAAGGGIRASVRHLRAAGADLLAEKAELYFRRFLAHGTTTIEAKSGYGLSLEDEIKSLRVLAALRSSSRLETISTFLGAHDVPDEFRDSREEYVRTIIEDMIPRVAQEKLAHFCDVFCDHGYFSLAESRAILQAAKQAGMALRIHADQLSHSGGARLAAELGAASADHLEWIDEEDIDRLRAAGTMATLVPGSTFNLGLDRYPPARKLIDSGVPVALATDFNPGSCFTLNMQIILSIACSQMKMNPAETITAATLNAAHSLGFSDRLGSLEEGKQADVVLMQCRDYREIPYFFGVNNCVLTVKKGNIVINRMERT